MSTSYNNRLSGEPALLANKRATSKSASLKQSLADCLYSLSNLIIIFACIIGLYFTVKFINDDPLYEYGEHLLTLKFYRQLIYIIVVFPLIVLVPLFNAVSAFLFSDSQKSPGQPTLIAKMAYQIFVALLAFVALVFVAPSIKYSSLMKQIDYEVKRHMQFRYDKDFSYEFLDRIQRQYNCCDEEWYRANYNDRIPTSCYEDDTQFTKLHQQTCPETIGLMVSTRCSIIAVCLLAILIGLAILVALDVLKLISAKENYDVRAREQALVASASNGTSNNKCPSLNDLGSSSHASIIRRDNSDNDDDDDDGGFMHRETQDQQNRLRSGERRRERPLLTGGRNSPLAEQEPDLESDLDLDYFKRRYGLPAQRDELPPPTPPPPPILTRANYISRPAETRPKSPVFVNSRSSSPGGQTRADSRSSSPGPTRGVLKKTSSLSRSIDRDSLIGRETWLEQSTTDFESHQSRLQQSLQSQRPLLNVRFAE